MGWNRVFKFLLAIVLVVALIPLPPISIIPYVVVSSGAYKTPITIVEHSGNTLTDYQVKIELNSTNWDGWNHVSNNGSDIYFTDSSGNPLYFWVEEFDYANQHAVIWVKVPSIPASSSVVIYLYYGGINSYPEYNDPKQVFVFFDDFEDGTINGHWYIDTPSGVVTESNGYLVFDSNGENTDWWGGDTEYAPIAYVPISSNSAIDAKLANIEVITDDRWGADLFVAGDPLRDNAYRIRKVMKPVIDPTHQVVVDTLVNDVGTANIATSGQDVPLPIVFTITIYGTELKFYYNYILLYQTQASFNIYHAGLSGSDWYDGFNLKAYFDWFRIRNYVDPEPSVSIGASVLVGKYRTPITITNNIDIELTDYQVKILLNSTNWDGWDFVSSDGSDIYFLNSNGNPLYYWVEKFDAVNQEAIIWVKVPNIPASSSITIYMYYGGMNPYNTYNDPNNVFLLFDDFETWNGWTNFDYDGDGLGGVVQVDDIVYEGNYALEKVDDGDPDGGYKYLSSPVDITSGYGVIAEWYIYANDRTSAPYDQIYLIDDNGNGYNWAFYHPSNLLYAMRRDSYTRVDLVNSYGSDYSGSWVKAQLIILPNGTIKARYYLSGIWYEVSALDTTYTYFTRLHVDGGYPYWIDNVIVRKYVDPEPSVSIGSSEAVVGGFSPVIESVSPSSVEAQPGDIVSFMVSVVNTGGESGGVYVRLYDHNSVVRDEESIMLDPDQSVTVTLSTTVSEDERGDWTWTIKVENDTYVFDSYDVSVSIHYNLTYTFNHTIQSSVNLSVSPIETNNITYNISVLGSINVSAIETYTPYPMIWGTKYCLDLYTNSTGNWGIVYHECGAYVDVIYVNIHYIIESPYPDVVGDYIIIKDYDTEETVTYIYIPFGNTSRVVFSNKYYVLEIPQNGTTLHGYSYELVRYVVDGVENPDTIYVDKDVAVDIYYRIYGSTGGGGGWTPVTPPPLPGNLSEILPPFFSVGAPSLYSPQGIILLAFFIGLFIVYSRELSWGQALVVSSTLSMIISIILFGAKLVPLFMVLFIIGIGTWKILGK